MNTIIPASGKKPRDCSNFHIECRDHMLSNNISLAGLLLSDGRIHRFSNSGNSRKEDEFYLAHEGISRKGNPFLAVMYGTWRGGYKEYHYDSWKSAHSTDVEYSYQEKQEFEDKQRALHESYKKQRIDEQHVAAREAISVWGNARRSCEKPGEDDYLKLKQIDGVGIRFAEYHDKKALIVPLYNGAGELRNIQYIYEDHGSFDKRPIIGGEKKGILHCIENHSYKKNGTERIYVAEGWATAKTIYTVMDKRFPVIMALDAGNISSVVKVIRQDYQGEIVVAADNDTSGTGQAAATYTAKTYRCEVVIPSRVGYDFNDLYCALGKDATAHELVPEDTALLDKIKNDAKKHLEVKDPCVDFSVELLPTILRDYVQVLQLKTEAHPSMLVASILTMISAEIGKRAWVESHERLYPNVWFLCIAGSGRFKTTALRLGSRIASTKDVKVIRELRYLQGSLKHETDKEKKLQILQEIDDNRKLQRRWEPEGGSLRAFLERISLGGTPGIYLSEFGSFLRTISKEYNSGFKQMLTNLYDVPESGSYETHTSGSFYYDRPYFSLCGMSTPEWLQKETALDDAIGGFYARFLLYAPCVPFKRHRLLPENKTGLEEEIQRSADEVFSSSLDRFLNALGTERAYAFSADGEEALETYSRHIENLLGVLYDQEPYCSFVGRWGQYLIKLSLIMQIITDFQATEISLQAVEYAWNVLSPAIKSTLSLFTKEFATGKNEQRVIKVRDYIVRKTAEKGYAIRKEVLKSRCIDARAKEYDEIFILLIERGEIIEEPAVKKLNYRYRYDSNE